LNTLITSTPRALFGLCLALVSCGFGESGIAPPSNRIFFPAGIAVDPAGSWLYVVNSNSDLRFNAGTLVAVDLKKVAAARTTPHDRCYNSVFVQPESGDPHYCCVDYVDGHVLNCDERAFVDSAATVRTGSFGGSLRIQQVSDTQRRVFIAVRAEPSLTFVDIGVPAQPAAANDAGHVTMRCTPDGAGPNAFCTDDFRIKKMKAPDGSDVQFPEEPHDMLLDPDLGVLYISHLGGVLAGQRIYRGVSVIDVCHPENPAVRPRLASVLDIAFPNSPSFGVRSLTPERIGDPTAALLATSQITSEIAELVWEQPGQVKCDSAGRDLTLVAGQRFTSSAFGTRGADLRGLVLSDDDQRAYVLHHQFAVGGEYNPASVVEIDRRPDRVGAPVNQTLGVVDVCTGPNRLIAHDAGRGMRLFVNCFENGQIYVVEPNLLNIESVIELGAGPAELAFAPDDPTVAFVSGFVNNNVSVLDLKPGSPTEYRVIQRIGFARSTAIPQ
jgi:DNA-binding beta-propeller fold protein YncE